MDEGKEMGKFSGMLFTLKKREQNIEEDDSGLYKQLMLGYYDGLDIHTVDEWYTLRPKGLLERKLQVDLDSPYIDQYTIRAFVPKNSDELEKIGFTYEFWKKIGTISSNEYENYMQADRKLYPFVCMSLLNVTEEFVKQKNDLQEIQDSLTTEIQKYVNSAGYDWCSLHCAVFPSIGYSDFIMVFMTDNLKLPTDIINQMKTATVGNGVTMISSCYSICGFDKSFCENEKDKLDPSIKISIRINFKQGISAGYFLSCLKEEVKKDSASLRNDDEAVKEFIAEFEKNYYVTFGDSDCLILQDQPLEQYLKWYGAGNILNPSNTFFSQYIANVRTSVSIGGDKNVFGSSVCANTAQVDMKHYKELFIDFIKKYEKFLVDHNMPIRSSRAMCQIMKNFLNVARSSHGFDIRRIVGDAFQSLIKDMEYFIDLEQREKAAGISEETQNKDLEYDYRIKREEQYIVEIQNEFKEFMGGFISDLIRSDRPFIEGNILTHSSIGSCTKLLFAYSAMLEKMAKRDGRENEFSFLVSSGGCDRTEAIDLFDFANNNSEIKKPIIIIIPEMSLYDIQGTLFRILHEYMHFIGNRRRKERYRCIINAVSGYMAWEITELDFNDQRKDELIKKAVYHLSSSIKDDVKESIENEWQKLKTDAQEKIAKEISSQSIFSDYESKKEEAFYAAVLKESVLHIESMVDIFSVTEDKFRDKDCKNIQKKIYTILYEADKQLVKFIINKLKKVRAKNPKDGKSVLLPLQCYEMLLQNYEFKEINSEEYDRKLKRFIEQYIESLLRNFPLNTGGVVTFQAKYDYETILDEIMMSFIEAFSDCAAARTIDMKVEDFLLSFIYEIWDIDQAFPETVGNILRLGSDLSVLYGITGKLSDDVKKRVQSKNEKRKKQGYSYRNMNQMFQSIDIILNRYCLPEFESVRKEIERYLKLCVGSAGEWYSGELGELYKLCDMNDSKETYKVVDKIIGLWKSLSGEY